ncbi:bifunctional phosphopantothenoylcysteine decarboxylase/phosphopantothenate synthase [Fadolivirus algeromassiliense]|jgi:phosphopantothenoylcysteine decarboxylase|uniref:Bifunctional phosphopantothenoylcysteine decarboxylase/phosphopantothenate synthase n=1 Tax=Fadolivirus FV1/VV64 TaxID=3070911 RepID=A0A7D3QWG9_9VIRU|nr:bifunctional phosphopantothenoylcysteine decarboxylase/phosphopantothenate synthase [Fadolivirus algeromassiliense]QKF94559.1 bifunctional phosphopantothenoylcysteine decarboxylase/phosphopantothenate synthase [Fadolivirus FV1/VV64]
MSNKQLVDTNYCKKNLLLCCSGSIATIKLRILVESLCEKFNIKIILTKQANFFFQTLNDEEKNNIRKVVDRIYLDDDEWYTWQKRNDPIIHIELKSWADIALIAPLSANSMAKICNGICDNLLTNIFRAWPIKNNMIKKPIFVAPAMNTDMYTHPITQQQFDILLHYGYKIIPCISKTLMCGEFGIGAMADTETIIKEILNY